MALAKAFLFIFVLIAAAPSRAAELKVTNEGIGINAGSLGTFTLKYPEFDPAHKAIEVKTAAGSATIRYEGGAECAITITGNDIGLSFKNVPGDVQKWKMSALIDIGFAKGGAWKIAEKSGNFPAEKASPSSSTAMPP